MMLNIIILVVQIVVLIISIKVNKVPKWEYFKDGIRFYNKKGEVTIENDKPLIK